MAIKGRSLGIEVEDYQSDRIDIDTIYKGYTEMELLSKEIDQIYDGGLEVPEMEEPIYPNEFFFI